MIFSEEQFVGKHLLITGATGGIGMTTALKAAELGMHVSLTGRNQDKLQEVADACRRAGDSARVTAIAADLTKEEDRTRIVEEAEAGGGPIDYLVNNAGIAKGTVLERLEEADLRDVMELNFTSTVLLTQEVFRHMKARETGGGIVNVASLSGLRGVHGATAYCGSKFALIGFTQSFAYEAIEDGVRVNAVCPGFVETGMAKDIIKRKAEREGISFENKYDQIVDGLPAKRITRPEEVVNSILYLLSPAAVNIIGESLKISAGAVMHG
ncbi:SDR family NAD(P)-dependent oxidoreductase [Salisediminibacterium selenitireducens]|uniref:Short-chain dehydrogenase/reductase SDR n=1 Tax=Bacillus selenitireducens (strain ATCC 700615 / DSM 15326 / MLS10) TaxID=439292 RepID=D6Y086_BACIE|nr:SDR family oxidoreductase [Salisediminibacterium selenitireducens]ADH98477.1 short-chain dehydrogenase/reductase SDR [[Bacillus] selenitireducens MLS10]